MTEAAVTEAIAAMDPKEIIARRVAKEVRPGMLVNLGIGLPSLVANHLPVDAGVYSQAENGVIGLGSRPPEGMEDVNLTDAGGGFVTAVPGAASIDSAMSFGLIRGGHLDMTVLGGLQVDERGFLANWMVPGKMIPGMGGAMDLVSGAKKVVVAMIHSAKGEAKIVPRCTLPADGRPSRQPDRDGTRGDRADRQGPCPARAGTRHDARPDPRGDRRRTHRRRRPPRDGPWSLERRAPELKPRRDGAGTRGSQMSEAAMELPHAISKHDRLIAKAQAVEPARTIVAHPCDETSLRGAVEAAEMGLIRPILVGPEAKMRSVAEAGGLSLAGIEIVDAPHSHAAAEQAVALVREGKGELLMKGSLHTDELMREVTASATGLRTARRISHVFVMDVPGHEDTLFITDAAINIFPDLDTKRDIVQNAIDLWNGIGGEPPRVAILSAVETVTKSVRTRLASCAVATLYADARRKTAPIPAV
jgi:3-oxoacid CoA-transferase B subunit